MQSARYAIYCFANCLLCFQVELDWFTARAAAVQFRRSIWPCVEIFRAISSSCSRKSVTYTSRTLDTFGLCAKESLGADLRNSAIDSHFQVDCRVVLPSLADVCKAQTYSFKWSPLKCDANTSKIPGDSLKLNCSGKLAKQVVSATDIESSPGSYRKMKEPGNEVPRDWTDWAFVVRTENKQSIHGVYSFHISS